MTPEPPLDEAALPALLARFYGRVRDDAALGPVFNDAIRDWPVHLARIEAFWSSVMLTTGRYKGNPVHEHLRHADRITPALFTRWLALWDETTTEMLPAAAARAIQDKARRIAASLQLALACRTPAQEALYPPPAPRADQA